MFVEHAIDWDKIKEDVEERKKQEGALSSIFTYPYHDRHILSALQAIALHSDNRIVGNKAELCAALSFSQKVYEAAYNSDVKNLTNLVVGSDEMTKLIQDANKGSEWQRSIRLQRIVTGMYDRELQVWSTALQSLCNIDSVLLSDLCFQSTLENYVMSVDAGSGGR
jgi:hypothetical protein